MNLTCLIVDDEPLARQLLTEYVRKIPYLELAEVCSSPLAALEVLRRQPVDLMFLDIQMPEITGLTLLKVLTQKPLVVLTTAYSEYALESYDLDVVDYLLKPISFDRFLRAVEKALLRKERQGVASSPGLPAPAAAGPEPAQPFIFVKDGTKLVKVRLTDILYVEGLKDYVAIHTRHQKIVTLQRLKNLEAQLPASQFIRIHHSYIVSLEGIDTVHKEKVQVGAVFLPISETYRKAFKDFIDRNHLDV
ncbi:MAG: LytR/AlgR family response regulator transcription factor [Adhaeribacter sp.]